MKRPINIEDRLESKDPTRLVEDSTQPRRSLVNEARPSELSCNQTSRKQEKHPALAVEELLQSLCYRGTNRPRLRLGVNVIVNVVPIQSSH
jgi:hypothetical protein